MNDHDLNVWLHMLFKYEMWCYDLGCLAVDDYTKRLNDWWEHMPWSLV